jgi:hypothetical protein
MKRKILFSFLGTSLFLLLLFKSGFIYVQISPYNSYRLTENESIKFENFISRFWEMVEKDDFDGINSELSDGEKKDWRFADTIQTTKKNAEQFGKIKSWRFFRSASPRITSEWAKNPDEKIYQIEYLTTAENGEFCAWFTFYITANNEIKLFGLSLDSPVEWRIEESDKQKLVEKKYPNEFIIPYGEQYIEFRY